MIGIRIASVLLYTLLPLIGAIPLTAHDNPPSPPAQPLIPRVRQIALAIDETTHFTTRNGEPVPIRLVGIRHTRDTIRGGIRSATATLRVRETEINIPVGGYAMPTVVENVKLDVAVTRDYLERNLKADQWRLPDGKDAILRIWDADSPLLTPGTFVYPVKQRFLSTLTQIGNEIVHVNGAGFEPPDAPIYYHCCVDIGGSDGLDEIIAAVGGVVCVHQRDVYPPLKAKGVNGRSEERRVGKECKTRWSP